MSEDTYLWVFPALVAVVIVLQLHHGRVPIGWTPRGWHVVEKAEDEGRFWLFIVAECLLVLILIGQALSA